MPWLCCLFTTIVNPNKDTDVFEIMISVGFSTETVALVHHKMSLRIGCAHIFPFIPLPETKVLSLCLLNKYSVGQLHQSGYPDQYAKFFFLMVQIQKRSWKWGTHTFVLSLLLTADILWWAVSISCQYHFSDMDCNLELWTKIKFFSHK